MGHQLYIFIIIDLDTRELIFINANYNPDFEWVKQQFKNAFFDRDDYTLCICDNDSIVQTSFEKMLKDYFKMRLKRIPYNPHSALKKCKFPQLESCDFNTLAPFLGRLPRSLRHPFFRKGGDLSLKCSPSFNPPTTLISLLLC